MSAEPTADIRAFPTADVGSEQTVAVIGIGPRLLAGVLDSVLVGVLSIIVAIIAGLTGELLGMFSANISAWGAFFTAVSGLVFSLAYYVYSWTNGGQTLAQILLGLKVVTADGAPPSLSKAILRYVGFVVSALALSLGFLWVTFDGKRQGWHDKIAGTYVVRTDESFTAADRVTFVPSDPGRAPVWIGLWVVLLLFAPGALFAGLLMLGPFVDMAIKALRGG
jgi:uncharacterized RDD family membrane protein YckC